MMSDKANGCARLRDCQFSKMTKRGEAYKELGSSWANNLARPNFLFMCRLDCEDSINLKWTSFRIIGREWWWWGEEISVVTVVKWQWIRASQVKSFSFFMPCKLPITLFIRRSEVCQNLWRVSPSYCWPSLSAFKCCAISNVVVCRPSFFATSPFVSINSILGRLAMRTDGKQELCFLRHSLDVSILVFFFLFPFVLFFSGAV